MKVTDDDDEEGFKPQDRVIYIPGHANGARTHKDCERGTVSSVGAIGYVFVRFDRQVAKLGWDETTSQCCDVRDLRHL